MFKIAIGVSALAFFAGSAMAEPLTLTDDQMDTVTAGLTVSGNAILSFECDAVCVGNEFTEPVMIVIAGENDLATGPQLPFEVHDNGMGAGPWMGALSPAGTPADVANGGPISHDPLIIAP